jgi:hypothetical protein
MQTVTFGHMDTNKAGLSNQIGIRIYSSVNSCFVDIPICLDVPAITWKCIIHHPQLNGLSNVFIFATIPTICVMVSGRSLRKKVTLRNMQAIFTIGTKLQHSILYM